MAIRDLTPREWAMDITFHCDKCGQHIVICEAGARLQVQCPKCGTPLEVPHKSKPLDKTPPPTARDTKTCPFCAETIKAEARICRFCGCDLVTGQRAAGNAESASTGASSPLTKIFAVAVIIAALIGGFFAYNFWKAQPTAKVESAKAKLTPVGELQRAIAKYQVVWKTAHDFQFDVRKADSMVSPYAGIVTYNIESFDITPADRYGLIADAFIKQKRYAAHLKRLAGEPDTISERATDQFEKESNQAREKAANAKAEEHLKCIALFAFQEGHWVAKNVEVEDLDLKAEVVRFYGDENADAYHEAASKCNLDAYATKELNKWQSSLANGN